MLFSIYDLLDDTFVYNRIRHAENDKERYSTVDGRLHGKYLNKFTDERTQKASDEATYELTLKGKSYKITGKILRELQEQLSKYEVK